MSDNVQTMMFDILKSIQKSISELDARVDGRLSALDNRMNAIEELLRKQRRDTAGILVMMKGVVGVFEERVTNLETRVTLIEMNREKS